MNAKRANTAPLRFAKNTDCRSADFLVYIVLPLPLMKNNRKQANNRVLFRLTGVPVCSMHLSHIRPSYRSRPLGCKPEAMREGCIHSLLNAGPEAK